MRIGITVEKLESRLHEAHVDPMAYSIGGHGDDQYCLEQGPNGQWLTYFGQRGQRKNLMEWEDEGDACMYLLGQLAWDEWLT